MQRVVLLILVMSVAAAAQGPVSWSRTDTVVIRPEETDEVLLNPGMGIQTFQRFNGQPLNEGLRWSEEGPTAVAADAPYDGLPYLDSVDVSSVGYWGEGWSDYMPDLPTQKALIDIYFDAFKRTPLLMNFDEARALAYGTERGAGWRLDCWGDMGGQWEGGHSKFSHMLDFYPQQVARTGIQEVWRRS